MHINCQGGYAQGAAISSLLPFSKSIMPTSSPNTRNRLTLKDKAILCTYARTPRDG